MKTTLATLVIVMTLLSCDEKVDTSVPCNQGVEATVRDLTNLDGCGFIFELKDGTKLEPLRLFICGTPPLPKEVTEDPLYQFEWKDGKKVVIGYEEQTEYGSYCMVGPVVKITCISEVGVSQGSDK